LFISERQAADVERRALSRARAAKHAGVCRRIDDERVQAAIDDALAYVGGKRPVPPHRRSLQKAASPKTDRTEPKPAVPAAAPIVTAHDLGPGGDNGVGILFIALSAMVVLLGGRELVMGRRRRAQASLHDAYLDPYPFSDDIR
jgi:hypothetical protein